MLKSNLLLSTTIALLLAVQPMKAAAAVSPESIAADLQAQGFTFIEITQGPTQSKVEATKGGTKIETIIDNETGEVLKSETEAADPADIGRTGVKTRTKDRDFLDASDDDRNDENEDRNDDRDDDRDGDDDHAGDDDRGDHGGDDHGGGDHSGGGHGGHDGSDD